MWDEYDPVINDRELHYASLYGINCVRVYLHYFVYLKNREALLSHIDDFLSRADKYGIKDLHHEGHWDREPGHPAAAGRQSSIHYGGICP